MTRAISFVLILWLLTFPAQAFSPIENYKSIVSESLVSVPLEKDKLTVVVFLSNECPCSNSHIEHLKELTQNFSGVTFVGVHTGDATQLKTAADYYKAKNLNFTVLVDTEQKLVKEFKALRTPHAYLLKGSSAIYSGGVTDDAHFPAARKFYLKKALQEALNNQSITDAHSKLNGCYIERI